MHIISSGIRQRKPRCTPTAGCRHLASVTAYVCLCFETFVTIAVERRQQFSCNGWLNIVPHCMVLPLNTVHLEETVCTVVRRATLHHLSTTDQFCQRLINGLPNYRRGPQWIRLGWVQSGQCGLMRYLDRSTHPLSTLLSSIVHSRRVFHPQPEYGWLTMQLGQPQPASANRKESLVWRLVRRIISRM